MVKGLYFKLNMDNERDKIIYSYFNNIKGNKVDMLYQMIMYVNEVCVSDISIFNKGLNNEQNT